MRRNRLSIVKPVRVLLLTFNRTLRGYVQALANQHADPSDEIELTVDTFGRWARNLIGSPNILQDATMESRFRDLLSAAGFDHGNVDYFKDEIHYVLGRFLPSQRDDYLNVDRSGRGRSPAVPRPLRKHLLDGVIAPYELDKTRNDELDWHDVALEAAKAPNQLYDIVIVDECQDFSANNMRAIIAHLDIDHATTFIIDAAQRIYPQVFTWTELGIAMRPNMVYTLEDNHRNTVEVARLASCVVRGLPVGPEGVLPDPQKCQISGEKPQVVVGRYNLQIEYMITQIEPFLEVGETAAILQPWGGGWFDHVRHVLQQRGIRYCDLTRNRHWPTGPEQLAISTIHSAKGLEFDHVLMPGLSQEVTPHGHEDGDGRLDSLRRLVAMGIGRARRSVMLGYKCGCKSTLFEFIDEDCYELIRV